MYAVCMYFFYMTMAGYFLFGLGFKVLLSKEFQLPVALRASYDTT